MGDNPTVVELERENARLQAKLAAAEVALAEAKAECLDVYGKLAASSEMAAQYIAAKVELEAALSAMTEERNRWRDLVAERTAERNAACARADGMERAGAEQAGRADQNYTDLIATQVRIAELERNLAAAERDLRTLGHNTDEAAATALDAGTRIKELERDLAAATARVAKLEQALEEISANPSVLYWTRRIARAALDDGDAKKGGA